MLNILLFTFMHAVLFHSHDDFGILTMWIYCFFFIAVPLNV